MSILLSDLEQIFGTGPDPRQIGVKITSLTIEDLIVTGDVTLSGISIRSEQLVAPAIAVGIIEVVSPLAANMPLILAPKGQGGISMDIPDNAITGGNQRGNYAVDLQQVRVAATEVASGLYSFLAGTFHSSATGQASAVVGGQESDATNTGAVSIGSSQATASGIFSSAISSGPITVSGDLSTALAVDSPGAVAISGLNAAAIASNVNMNIGGTRVLVAAGSGVSVTTSTSSATIASDTCTLLNTLGGLIAGSDSCTINNAGPRTGMYSCSSCLVTNWDTSALMSCFNTNNAGTAQYSAGIASSVVAIAGTNSAVVTSTTSTVNVGSVRMAIISCAGSNSTGDTSCMVASTTTATSGANVFGAGLVSGSVAADRVIAFGSGVNVATADNFIFSDNSAGTVSPPNANSFTVRSTGATAAVFYSNAGATTGVTLAAGASAWAAVSDRRLKENLAPVDGRWASKLVAGLPLYTYNFIGNPAEQRCVGPMAQDWAQAFPTNKSAVHLDTMDFAGVTCAALQHALWQIDQLHARVAQLEAKSN